MSAVYVRFLLRKNCAAQASYPACLRASPTRCLDAADAATASTTSTAASICGHAGCIAPSSSDKVRCPVDVARRCLCHRCAQGAVTAPVAVASAEERRWHRGDSDDAGGEGGGEIV